MDLLYPLAVDPDGAIRLSKDLPTAIAGAIRSGLATVVEERVWRPEYGLVRAVLSTYYSVVPVLGQCRAAIETALEGYPGVNFSLSGYLGDDGVARVTVEYQVDDITYTLEDIKV
jgi:hypothetical protein